MLFQSAPQLGIPKATAAVVSIGILCLLGAGMSAQADQPIPVKLRQSPAGSWTLERGGKPYYIQGAGGPGPLELLVESGANSTRTWGVDQLQTGRLDDAHRHGLSVAVGIWLKHRQHLDYDDNEQVAEQTETVLRAVRRYKHHPAVLLWGIGNEMEGQDGDSPAVWGHVEQLARRIKQEDPLHPTMSVVAEIEGRKVEAIHQLCPSLDIIGINSYDGASSLPERYRKAGGTKPYIVTEFGPRGPWQVPKNKIDSIDEESGHSKAAAYLAIYRAIKNDRQLCLGSYAFLWGHKQEATATWFGILLPDGRKTPALDVLTEQWTGKAPHNLCPRIEKLTLPGTNIVNAASSVQIELQASDPEAQPLHVEWVLMEDAKRYRTGGNFQETPPSLQENILEASTTSAQIRAPEKAGLYRIYVYVDDGGGGADVANIVFRVEEATPKPSEQR